MLPTYTKMCMAVKSEHLDYGKVSAVELAAEAIELEKGFDPVGGTTNSYSMSAVTRSS